MAPRTRQVTHGESPTGFSQAPPPPTPPPPAPQTALSLQSRLLLSVASPFFSIRKRKTPPKDKQDFNRF